MKKAYRDISDEHCITFHSVFPSLSGHVKITDPSLSSPAAVRQQFAQSGEWVVLSTFSEQESQFILREKPGCFLFFILYTLFSEIKCTVDDGVLTYKIGIKTWYLWLSWAMIPLGIMTIWLIDIPDKSFILAIMTPFWLVYFIVVRQKVNIEIRQLQQKFHTVTDRWR